MNTNSGEASQCEAPKRADAHDNTSTANKSDWSNVSRQCLADNSQWKAAKGGFEKVDPTLDKAALASGVLQFGPISDASAKPAQAGEAAVKGLSADNSPSPSGKENSSSGKAIDGNTAALFDKNSTNEQKLAAVRELANAGTTNVSYRDTAGNDHKFRLEVQGAGQGQMVHLFAQGADGKEQTALRGISRADGSFEQERDRTGKSVDFKGKGYSQLSADQPGSTNRVNPVKPVLPKDNTEPDKGSRPSDLPTGSIDRSQFDSQLKDPRVMAAFAGRMNSEVGSQGPAAQLAFAEEVMNRAASRNQTVMQALTGNYYPTHNPGSSHNPEYIHSITKAWNEGTDTIQGATGNASGRVGFGVSGGHYDGNRQWVSPNQTARINGERFGYEQVDLNKGWLQKYQQLKSGSQGMLAKIN